MEKNSLVVVEQPQNVQTTSVLIIEQFLNDNYRLRRNMLSGKVEFKIRAEVSADYRPLTQEALNSIIIHALREGLDEECNPKADITMYVNSEEVRMYNPVLAFLNDLPQCGSHDEGEGRAGTSTCQPRLRAQESQPCGLLQSCPLEGSVNVKVQKCEGDVRED